MMCRQQSPIESIRDREGYALLLAVVITSAVLSAASALAGIIIGEIRQTRQTSGAIAAYAAAEQSTERAIFLLRQSDTPLDDLAGIPEGTTIERYNEPQHFSIPESDFVSLPISPISQDDVFTAPRISGWEIAECPHTSWIEVTTITWQNDEFNNLRQPYPLNEGGAAIAATFPEGTPVEMRIRALYCDINDLQIENIPGRYRIVATGQQGDVRQAIETFITRKPPASGLFDFVLFSECEVIKGGGREREPSCPL